MTDLQIDLATRDLIITESGDWQLIDTEQELATQQVDITLRCFRGEWFANIEFGIPWITNDNNSIAIYGKVGQEVFDSYIKEGILSSEFVQEIVEYESVLDRNSGLITIDAKALTTNGEIAIINQTV